MNLRRNTSRYKTDQVCSYIYSFSSETSLFGEMIQLYSLGFKKNAWLFYKFDRLFRYVIYISFTVKVQKKFKNVYNALFLYILFLNYLKTDLTKCLYWYQKCTYYGSGRFGGVRDRFLRIFKVTFYKVRLGKSKLLPSRIRKIARQSNRFPQWLEIGEKLV